MCIISNGCYFTFWCCRWCHSLSTPIYIHIQPIYYKYWSFHLIFVITWTTQYPLWPFNFNTHQPGQYWSHLLLWEQQQHLQHQRAIQPKHQQRQRQILKHWEYAVIQPPAVNCYNVQQNQLHHQQHDISHAVCTRRFSRYRTLWSTTWLIRFSQHSSIPRIIHTITLLFCSQFGGGFAVAKLH